MLLKPIPLKENDLFTWGIVYNDGKIINEFDVLGQVINPYPGDEIDIETNDFINEEAYKRFENIKKFYLYKVKDVLISVKKGQSDKNKIVPFIVINIPSGGRLIWRRRSVLDGNSKIIGKIYIAGWRKMNRNKVNESILNLNVMIDNGKLISNIEMKDNIGCITFFKFELFPFEKGEILNEI